MITKYWRTNEVGFDLSLDESVYEAGLNDACLKYLLAGNDPIEEVSNENYKIPSDINELKNIYGVDMIVIDHRLYIDYEPLKYENDESFQIYDLNLDDIGIYNVIVNNLYDIMDDLEELEDNFLHNIMENYTNKFLGVKQDEKCYLGNRT